MALSNIKNKKHYPNTHFNLNHLPIRYLSLSQLTPQLLKLSISLFEVIIVVKLERILVAWDKATAAPT